MSAREILELTGLVAAALGAAGAAVRFIFAPRLRAWVEGIVRAVLGSRFTRIEQRLTLVEERMEGFQHSTQLAASKFEHAAERFAEVGQRLTVAIEKIAEDQAESAKQQARTAEAVARIDGWMEAQGRSHGGGGR